NRTGSGGATASAGSVGAAGAGVTIVASLIGISRSIGGTTVYRRLLRYGTGWYHDGARVKERS
ncbi:MAG: hypothetical protein WA965_05615, partial [Mycobacterium sp.]